jgi:ferredoxin
MVSVDIHIAIEACDGCGLCVDFCPVKVLRIHDGIPTVDKLNVCYACNTCEDLCPHGAITIEPKIPEGGKRRTVDKNRDH